MNVIFLDKSLEELYLEGNTKDRKYKKLCKDAKLVAGYQRAVKALQDANCTKILKMQSFLHYEKLNTLIHEMTHIMLGISAGHAGSESFYNERNEKYCDMVAAEFLVPMSVLREIWNNDIKYVSRRFKTSELVIARRAHDIGIITDEKYKDFWLEYSQRPKRTDKSKSGGSFYLTSVRRVGRNFAIHVRNAVNSKQLSYTEAYRLTGLYGKTYDNFMSNNI